MRTRATNKATPSPIPPRLISTNSKPTKPKEPLTHRAIKTAKTLREIGLMEYMRSWFIFSPAKESFEIPASLTNGDFSTNEVWFPNKSGNNLHGYLVKNQKERRDKLAIFLQGTSPNASFWLQRLEQVPHHTGLDLFVPNYSGYEQSEGFPTKEGILEDIGAAHKFAKNQGYKPENIYFLCHSLGTLAGLEYHAYRNGTEPAGTVLFGPPTSLKDAARVNLGRTYAMFTPKHAFNSRKTITTLRHRILIVCGDEDKKSPIEQARELHNIALSWGKDSSLVSVIGGHHNDLFNKEDVLSALNEFTSKLQ